MIFNLLLTFQELNVEKRFVFQSLKNRAFNILYNLWNSAESNLENAVNGISGVLDPPRRANAFGVRLTYAKS